MFIVRYKCAGVSVEDMISFYTDQRKFIKTPLVWKDNIQMQHQDIHYIKC